ncbi:MAG: PhzF family phenazine biosynthesis protein [Woeseiaceae bacterium]|nr:PhzF family phenazine biosynthesis protein [Woeseiaceae bacterium]
MTEITCLHVDAFAERPFTGNPAAVCLLESERDAGWMQHVAAEMNLSETAFVTRLGDAFSLRWFTPTVEVDLCGHATLASAHALWEEGVVPADSPIRFQTRSGELSCSNDGDIIELDLPATQSQLAEPDQRLIDGLTVEPLLVMQSKNELLALLPSEAKLRSLQPDLAALAALPRGGIVVTAASKDAEFDFVSRFFGPAIGIDEDPVTGAAHCFLGPFWGERLGKQNMLAYQASPRGGTVRIRLGGERIFLGGTAVTISRGQLLA